MTLETICEYEHVDWAYGTAQEIIKETAKDIIQDIGKAVSYLGTKPGLARGVALTGIAAYGLVAPLAVSWLCVRIAGNVKEKLDEHYHKLEEKNEY